MKTSKKDSKSKTLDFIELKESTDWWNELNDENKASIERGLEDLKNGRVHSDEDVRKSVRDYISKAKKE
jgi:predicted transcriptional regulator